MSIAINKKLFNEFGLGTDGRLVNRNSDVIERKSVVETFVSVTVTSAQLLALNATPVEIVPAPGSGKLAIFKRAFLYKPAGTAYAGIASGEDLVFKYTDASGVKVSSVIETTGFLDSASATRRLVGMPGAADGTTAADINPSSNAAIVLHLLSGEITTGTSVLYVNVWYDIIANTLGV